MTWTSSSDELDGCVDDEYSLKYALSNLDQCRAAGGAVFELPAMPVNESEILLTDLQPNSVYNVIVTPVIGGIYGVPLQGMGTTIESGL